MTSSADRTLATMKPAPDATGQNQWQCHAEGCADHHPSRAAAAFHQHEAHGFPCRRIVALANRIVLSGHREDF